MEPSKEGVLQKDLDVIAALQQQLAEKERHIENLNGILREHSEAAAIFRPGGRLHEQAKLKMGSSMVVEGIKWLEQQLSLATAEVSSLTADRDRLRSELEELRMFLRSVEAFLTSTKQKPVPTHAFSASRKGTLKGVEWNWTNVCDVCGGGLEDPQHVVSQSRVGRSAKETSVSKAKVETQFERAG